MYYCVPSDCPQRASLQGTRGLLYFSCVDALIAPSARALSTSVPLRTPESNSIGMFAPVGRDRTACDVCRLVENHSGRGLWFCYSFDSYMCLKRVLLFGAKALQENGRHKMVETVTAGCQKYSKTMNNRSCRISTKEQPQQPIFLCSATTRRQTLLPQVYVSLIRAILSCANTIPGPQAQGPRSTTTTHPARGHRDC